MWKVLGRVDVVGSHKYFSISSAKARWLLAFRALCSLSKVWGPRLFSADNSWYTFWAIMGWACNDKDYIFLFSNPPSSLPPNIGYHSPQLWKRLRVGWGGPKNWLVRKFWWILSASYPKRLCDRPSFRLPQPSLAPPFWDYERDPDSRLLLPFVLSLLLLIGLARLIKGWGWGDERWEGGRLARSSPWALLLLCCRYCWGRQNRFVIPLSSFPCSLPPAYGYYYYYIVRRSSVSLSVGGEGQRVAEGVKSPTHLSTSQWAAVLPSPAVAPTTFPPIPDGGAGGWMNGWMDGWAVGRSVGGHCLHLLHMSSLRSSAAAAANPTDGWDLWHPLPPRLLDGWSAVVYTSSSISPPRSY